MLAVAAAIDLLVAPIAPTHQTLLCHRRRRRRRLSSQHPQMIRPANRPQILPPSDLVGQIYRLGGGRIARRGGAHHQGADETIVLPDLGVLGLDDNAPRHPAVMGRDALPPLVLLGIPALKSQRVGVRSMDGPQRAAEAQRRGFDLHGDHLLQNRDGPLGPALGRQNTEDGPVRHDVGKMSDYPHLLPLVPRHLPGVGLDVLRCPAAGIDDAVTPGQERRVRSDWRDEAVPRRHLVHDGGGTGVISQPGVDVHQHRPRDVVDVDVGLVHHPKDPPGFGGGRAAREEGRVRPLSKGRGRNLGVVEQVLESFGEADGTGFATDEGPVLVGLLSSPRPLVVGVGVVVVLLVQIAVGAEEERHVVIGRQPMERRHGTIFTVTLNIIAGLQQ
mmetsp:Transcript_10297/g.28931  ORF Transcript_10297/g.28931 Transcript_10297/m.28931 type:complete len:387 (-) Transcript_10297:150-1310(-)